MPSAELSVIHAGPLAEAYALAATEHAPSLDRMHRRDHTLWRDDPTEVADRLGWLDAPARGRDLVDAMDRLAQEAMSEGFFRVVVVGMGGSSLFPEVLAATFPALGLQVEVLDSTHPVAVRRVLDHPADQTLFVISSKSGTTLETRSQLDVLWASREQALDEPGRAFVAVTDPGSELEALAHQRGFRAVVHGDTDVGGRFSALTAFGLVPAALLGMDVGALLDAAADRLGAEVDPAHSPGFQLGVLLAVAASAGRDKVTLVLDPKIASFGAWVEQLVAESLGKDDMSVVPIVGDDRGRDIPISEDRIHVVVGNHPAIQPLVAAGGPVAVLPLLDTYDLGAQVITWEIATAVAGAILGLQPFDQPDVAAAKTATAEVLAAGLSTVAVTSLRDVFDVIRPGDLVAITAFVDPASPRMRDLERIRGVLTAKLGNATTLGIGPRYLHSTGQLHKGGSDRIVVLQVVDDSAHDVVIPGREESLRTIFLAQAEGDLAALRSRGRRAFRVGLLDLLDA